MIEKIRIEILKIWYRKSTHIAFLGILVFLILMCLGHLSFKFQYGKRFQDLRGLGYALGLDPNQFVSGLSFAATTTIIGVQMLLPLFIGLIAGEQIAAEAKEGTLRAILIRPISRNSFLVAKIVATFIYTVIIILGMSILSLGIGVIVLGSGELLILKDILGIGHGIEIYPMKEGLLRYIIFSGLACYAFSVTAAIGIFLSVLVKNTSSAVIGVVAAFHIGHIIGNMPFFSALHPYLFTGNMYNLYMSVFRPVIPWRLIMQSAIYVGAYSATFLTLSFVIFRMKDIHS